MAGCPRDRRFTQGLWCTTNRAGWTVEAASWRLKRGTWRVDRGVMYGFGAREGCDWGCVRKTSLTAERTDWR